MGAHDGGLVLPEHFETWYRLHRKDIFVYAERRVGPSTAEDICAQTFSEAWRRLDRFDSSRGSERAWLFGIATNLLRVHRRTEARRLAAYARATAMERDAFAELDDVVAALEAEARCQVVAGRMKSLRAEERDIVWMAAAGLTYAEIADALESPIGTVRSQLSRVRRKLAR